MIRTALCGVLVLLLAMPGLRADDKPKDDQKPSSPKEQFDALVKDYNSQRAQILSEARKLKGAEQQKEIQKLAPLGSEFAEKVLKIVEDNPKDPVATDALFWVVQNGGNSPARTKAMEKVSALVADMPIKDLTRRLATIRGAGPEVLEAVFKRAEKEDSDQSADLLAWLVRTGPLSPVGSKAIDRLVEKFPGNPAIEQICQMLGNPRFPNGEKTLEKIRDTSTNKHVKAIAALAIVQIGVTKVDNEKDANEADKAATEAEKQLSEFVTTYGKDEPKLKDSAEKTINYLNHCRVGKTAAEISAADLDGKEFKLSDYRGKVVLLDFWGNW